MSISVDGLTYSSLGSLPQHADKSTQFLLVRLLTGTATVTRSKSIARQTVDYSTLPSTPQTNTAAAAVADFLTSYSVGGNVTIFIGKTTSDNRKFYQDLLSEFSNFFLQSKQESHTAAFVFLYRILEKITYSVPLLYCSTQSDYMGTFNELKALFDPTVKGELGLFKKFLNQGRFIDQIKLDIPYTVNFVSQQGHQSGYYNLAVKHHPNFENPDPNLNQVEIKFRHVPELLKTLRNRFFHSLTGDGKDNIRMQDIQDSDEFFSCLNPTFCSFLAIVVLESIARKYRV